MRMLKGAILPLIVSSIISGKFNHHPLSPKVGLGCLNQTEWLTTPACLDFIIRYFNEGNTEGTNYSKYAFNVVCA